MGKMQKKKDKIIRLCRDNFEPMLPDISKLYADSKVFLKSIITIKKLRGILLAKSVRIGIINYVNHVNNVVCIQDLDTKKNEYIYGSGIDNEVQLNKKIVVY